MAREEEFEVEQEQKDKRLETPLNERQLWFLDNGYSRHMTTNKNLFARLDRNWSGSVSFGDDSKGVIQGSETIGNTSQTQIRHVLYVKGLKHNLLSISQLCDRGFRVCFDSHGCQVINVNINKVAFIGKKIKNMYVIFLDDKASESCLLPMMYVDSWL
ncbi:Uncharacterized protein TCM_036559 [Theobroma cacao]|uniref:Retrovirus-related Pol polyprotein from transposon TNT 1-94-like beta-barrel domain-containing protein n=1 Tax=Theobroma cacao TaxID=3641 RepID=A0A061FL36_THECC|nr:Uncharacterized protein TCM_036559 [Theobroma cacao]